MNGVKRAALRLHPRLVAVDLDGTFLDEHSAVSEASRRAAEEIMAQGIEFVVTSGRILSRFPKDVLSIEGMHFAVTANGASLLDLEEKRELFSDPIPEETAARILDAVFSFPVYCEVYSGNRAFTDGDRLRFFRDDFYTPNRLKAMNQSRNLVPGLRELVRQPGCGVQKVFLPHVSEEYKQAFEEKLFAIDGIEVTNSFPLHYEVNRQGCNKAHGLRQLCGRLGISAEEVMAFGDANNDSAMLRFAGMSVAMGNAGADVRRQARFIAKSNAEDGVACFLREHVL